MTVYRGVVRDGVVVLPQDVELADGTEVEVRTDAAPTGADAPDQRRLELARLLREAGLVLEFKHPPFPAQTGDRTPIHVDGKPLSEQIIEDRR